jgi:hypothetical protein
MGVIFELLAGVMKSPMPNRQGGSCETSKNGGQAENFFRTRVNW